jgi:hypothetical protein
MLIDHPGKATVTPTNKDCRDKITRGVYLDDFEKDEEIQHPETEFKEFAHDNLLLNDALL